MRSEAAQSIHAYDMRPVSSDIYVCDIQDKGGKMIKALRDWEERRGLKFTFKGKFIAPKLKPKIEEETPKVEQPTSRSIKVPRDKTAYNKHYYATNKEVSNARAKEWRSKLTPEQRAEINRRARELREIRKARLAANHKADGSKGT